MTSLESHSTRPYLIRAIHDWCTDNGFTPYLAVSVDATVDVPREYVKDGEIVLNVSYDATGSLQLGNDLITFKARFGGRPRDIMVPVERVIAIYARENGQGMAFPPPMESPAEAATPAAPARAPKPGRSASVAAPGMDSNTDERVVQLVPPQASAGDDAEDGDDSPEPPRPSGPGQRPALKRIK